MNKYIVTFDKSQEDIPTLIVGKEQIFSLTAGMDVVSVYTGDEAVKIWNKLGGKTEDGNNAGTD